GAPDPEIGGRDLDPSLDDRVGKVHLSIEFQGACLDGHGARGSSRLGGHVDDPHPHPQAGQPKGEHQAGRPGPYNQDQTVGHRSPPAFAPSGAAGAPTWTGQAAPFVKPSASIPKPRLKRARKFSHAIAAVSSTICCRLKCSRRLLNSTSETSA